MDLIQDILLNWVPIGFGLIGVVVLLIGILNLIGGKDKAFNSIFTGILIIAIAVGLNWLMQNVISGLF